MSKIESEINQFKISLDKAVEDVSEGEIADILKALEAIQMSFKLLNILKIKIFFKRFMVIKV